MLFFQLVERVAQPVAQQVDRKHEHDEGDAGEDRDPPFAGEEIVVADADQRATLMKWAHFHLFGGKGRRDVFVSELFRIVDGREGKDLLRGHEGGLAVRENDTLQTALEKMLDYQEDILPVLDSSDRVVGDLRLSEVLLKAIQEGEQRPA